MVLTSVVREQKEVRNQGAYQMVVGAVGRQAMVKLETCALGLRGYPTSYLAQHCWDLVACKLNTFRGFYLVAEKVMLGQTHKVGNRWQLMALKVAQDNSGSRCVTPVLHSHRILLHLLAW